jgi:hypothetical protein
MKIFAPIRFACRFFADQWRQFNPIGQALFALAVVMIAVDATISFKFGWSQTWVHAIGFAGLAVALFLLPDAAITEWRKGNKAGGGWLAVACIPIASVCLWTHVGYSSGVRLGDIEQSGFSHSAYESATTALEDKRKTLEMKREQLASAKAKSAKAAERNHGWTVAVDPVAMQSSLDALDSKIKNEAARVRCGPKCDALKVERGQLAARIALAKEENNLVGDIAKLESEIEEKAKEVAALAPKTSTTVSQVQMAAKLVNVGRYYLGAGDAEAVLKPTAFEQDIANTAASGLSSIAFLLVSTTLMTGAGFNRRHGIGVFEDQEQSPPVSDLGNRNPEGRAYPQPEPAPASEQAAPNLHPVIPLSGAGILSAPREVVRIRDDRAVWRDLRTALRNGMPQQSAFAA